MNIVLMVVMMGLAMVFFHGQGHPPRSSSSERHQTKPDEAEALPAQALPQPRLDPDPTPQSTHHEAPVPSGTKVE